MKKFKTERIIYFNTRLPTKLETEPDNILAKPKENSMNKFIVHKENLYPQYFANKKDYNFDEKKCDYLNVKQKKRKKKGRWTLKEHIQFLKALDIFGISWKKLSYLIPTRTSKQIRSHSQKFYKKLKACKDTELGIDFTSRHIKNVNDMIAHIKSVNKDYNIVTVFLYLSEKCYPDKNPKKPQKVDNININNILSKDMNINLENNSSDSDFNNDIKENIVNKEVIMGNKIINNNFNSSPTYNIFINNINYFNVINDLNSLVQLDLNNNITSKYINNNISMQNIPFNNMNILNNDVESKNLLDKNYIFDYPKNNFSLINVNKDKNNF